MKKINQMVLKKAVTLVKENATFFVGFGILVGSIGLILGTFTVAVSALVMQVYSWELVPAMVFGFGLVGVLSLLTGFLVMRAGLKN